MTINVKDASEQLQAIRDILDKVSHWAAPSIVRTLALIFSVAFVFFGASYFYVDGLLESSRENTALHNKELALGTEQNLLRYARDLVSECIDATKAEESLAGLYCKNAEEAYLARSTTEPYKSRALLSTEQDAYRSMRADLQSRIESSEEGLDRLAWSDPAGKTLNAILRSSVVALFATGAASALLLLYWMVLRARRTASANPAPEA